MLLVLVQSLSIIPTEPTLVLWLLLAGSEPLGPGDLRRFIDTLRVGGLVLLPGPSGGLSEPELGSSPHTFPPSPFPSVRLRDRDRSDSSTLALFSYACCVQITGVANDAPVPFVVERRLVPEEYTLTGASQ